MKNLLISVVACLFLVGIGCKTQPAKKCDQPLPKGCTQYTVKHKDGKCEFFLKCDPETDVAFIQLYMAECGVTVLCIDMAELMDIHKKNTN